MFTDNDSDSSTRPKPGRNPLPDPRDGSKPPKKKARRRDFPSEQLTERNPEGMDFSPALIPNEITDIEKMIETASRAVPTTPFSAIEEDDGQGVERHPTTEEHQGIAGAIHYVQTGRGDRGTGQRRWRTTCGIPTTDGES